MTELEKYQAFHQRVRQRKAEIPGELETLRAAGKGKTVQLIADLIKTSSHLLSKLQRKKIREKRFTYLK